MIEALREAARRLREAGVESPELEAELLLAHALGVGRLELRTRDRAVPAGYDDLVKRRCERYPLQYILGRTEFRGLEFEARDGVAIPKPSTEALVERALPECRGTAVDVCTGSGIVAVCLAKFGRAERVIATDFSDVALETARRNATRHGAKIEFRKADLLEGISALIDLVASNPPYIAADEWDRVDPEVRFEPRAALDGGFDGMGVIRRLIEQSRERLRPGGWLFMETGYHQAAAAQRLLVGFQEVRVFRDADGVERIVGGRR